VMKAPCLEAPKTYGEKAIILLRELNLHNKELKIQQVEDYLHIPLIREPLPIEIEKIAKSLPRFEISVRKFSVRTKRPLKLVDILEDKLAPHLLASLPHAIDFVGDIAVIEVPPELEPYKRIVGEAILKVHRRVRTVLAKSGAVGGVFRVREFEVVAGTGKTETVHKEHGSITWTLREPISHLGCLTSTTELHLKLRKAKQLWTCSLESDPSPS